MLSCSGRSLIQLYIEIDDVEKKTLFWVCRVFFNRFMIYTFSGSSFVLHPRFYVERLRGRRNHVSLSSPSPFLRSASPLRAFLRDSAQPEESFAKAIDEITKKNVTGGKGKGCEEITRPNNKNAYICNVPAASPNADSSQLRRKTEKPGWFGTASLSPTLDVHPL